MKILGILLVVAAFCLLAASAGPPPPPCTIGAVISGSPVASNATFFNPDGATVTGTANATLNAAGNATWAGTGAFGGTLTANGNFVATAGANSIMGKTVNAALIVSAGNPQGWSGSDVGAWINAAIQALPAAPTGGEVDVATNPGGCYSQTTQIVIDRPVKLRGQVSALSASGGTCLNWTGGASQGIVVNGASLGSSGATIEGFVINNGGTGTVAIDVYNNQYYVILRDLNIQGSWSVAQVRLGNGGVATINTKLDNVTLANGVIGMDILSANDVTCNNCHIYNNTSENVLVGDASHAAVNVVFEGGNVEEDSTSTAPPNFLVNNVAALLLNGVYTETDGGGNFLSVPNTATLAVGIRVIGGYYQGGGKTSNVFAVNFATADIYSAGGIAVNFAAGSAWVANTSSRLVSFDSMVSTTSNMSVASVGAAFVYWRNMQISNVLVPDQLYAFSTPEQATPAGLAVSGIDSCYGDSTAHALKCSYNNGTAYNMTQTIANGTASMTTAGIGTGACGTTVTVSAAGVATTDVINVTRNAAPTIGNGGGLTLNAWPTSGNVNFNYCNSAAGTITPTAMTVNFSVVR